MTTKPQYRECSPATKLKHEHFRQLADLHMKLCGNIFRRHRVLKPYTYIDLNSGPGIYPTEATPPGEGPMECSPISFLRIRRRYGLPTVAFFVEQDNEVYEHLKRNLQDYKDQLNGDNLRTQGFQMDNVDFTRWLLAPQQRGIARRIGWGLAYADPSGSGKHEFRALEILGHRFPKLDLLIHLQGSSMKRCQKVHGSDHGFLKLDDWLDRLGKKKYLIRLPFAKHQYSFLLGTNWKGYPAYKRLKFFGLDTKEGQACLKLLNDPRAEVPKEIRKFYDDNKFEPEPLPVWELWTP